MTTISTDVINEDVVENGGHAKFGERTGSQV